MPSGQRSKRICCCKICDYNCQPVDSRVARQHEHKYGRYRGNENATDSDTDTGDSDSSDHEDNASDDIDDDDGTANTFHSESETAFDQTNDR